MKRLVLACLVVVVATVLVATTAFAQPKPTFQLGFKALADQIPAIAGEPKESEHWGANGDSLQQTTTGLMVWRKSDNNTLFTDGNRSWVNGPVGMQERGNGERFDWEVANPARIVFGSDYAVIDNDISIVNPRTTFRGGDTIAWLFQLAQPFRTQAFEYNWWWFGWDGKEYQITTSTKNLSTSDMNRTAFATSGKQPKGMPGRYKLQIVADGKVMATGEIDVTAGLGEQVQESGAALTVNAVSKMGASTDGFSKAAVGKTFLVADVTVKDNSSSRLAYSSSLFRVKAADGYEYGATYVSGIDALKSGDLMSSEFVRGQIAFEIPSNAMGLVLSFEPALGFDPGPVIRISLDY